MYRTIIRLKKDITPERLEQLTQTVTDHFDNRAGRLENHSADPYEFIFEGENEQAFECIQLAIAGLTEPEYLEFVNVWDWIDEEDLEDCCSVIESYNRYMKDNDHEKMKRK